MSTKRVIDAGISLLKEIADHYLVDNQPTRPDPDVKPSRPGRNQNAKRPQSPRRSHAHSTQ